MGVTDLDGRTYEAELLVERNAVRAFVHATGDDPERWVGVAPPSYAAVALFAVAPLFLWDPEAGRHSNILIHADQKFVFHGAWEVGQSVTVRGQVEKIRMRGDTAWVTFVTSATRSDGTTVLDSTSLFLMSADEPAVDAAAEPEPGPFAKGKDQPAAKMSLPGAGEELVPLYKSASRSDLVQYAAASGDFNPLHWDHEVARAAGLPRIVCHGLLSAAWAMQQAARHVSGPAPVGEARFRFKQPLLAGDQAVVRGATRVVSDIDAELDVSVESAASPVVEARVRLTL